jgi:hypothetical protein
MLNQGKCDVSNCTYSHDEKIVQAEADRLLSESPFLRKSLNKQRLPTKSTPLQQHFGQLNRTPAFGSKPSLNSMDAEEDSEECA